MTVRTIVMWEGDWLSGQCTHSDLPPWAEHAIQIAQRDLLTEGCGAWTDEGACGQPASWVILGDNDLQEVMRRTTEFGEHLRIGGLCPRHAGSFSTITRDMPYGAGRDLKEFIIENFYGGLTDFDIIRELLKVILIGPEVDEEEVQDAQGGIPLQESERDPLEWLLDRIPPPLHR